MQVYGVKFVLHPIIIYSDYMANKKETILTVIALVIVLGGLFALLRNQVYNKQEPYIPITSPAKITGSISGQWTTHHNQTYHYRIDYPSDLEVMSPSSEPDHIGFAPAGSPWQIGVSRMPLFHSLEEWIKVSNEESLKYAYARENETPEESKLPGVTIERHVIISETYPGIIVGLPHAKDPSLQTIAFIKDGVLFQINIRNPDIDHERVWKSFTFE